jgi:hypothetical protein
VSLAEFERWTFADVVEAHEALDAIERMEHVANELAKAKAPPPPNPRRRR